MSIGLTYGYVWYNMDNMENKYTYEHYTKFPNVNVSLTKQNKTKNFEKCCKEQHVLNRQRIVISEQYSSYYLPISVGFYCTADIICFTSIFRGSHGLVIIITDCFTITIVPINGTA